MKCNLGMRAGTRWIKRGGEGDRGELVEQEDEGQYRGSRITRNEMGFFFFFSLLSLFPLHRQGRGKFILVSHFVWEGYFVCG